MANRQRSSIKPDTIRQGFQKWFVGDESSDGEQRAYCPICEDPDTSSSPSAMFNPEGDVWNCLKGAHGGSITRLASDLKKERGIDIRAQAAKEKPRSGSAKSPDMKKSEPPSSDAVAAWHEALLIDKMALDTFIANRGIDEDTIKEHEIGWDERTKRYTIPVYDRDGNLVNVRKYKMGAGRQEYKFTNLTGHGEARLFLDWVLDSTDWVILAEGEMDCLLLTQMGFPAVAGTGGAGTFKADWAERFTDKVVYIMYDNDASGEKGATRVVNALRNFAAVIYIVPIPMDREGADVTDLVIEEGYEAEDFEELLDLARGHGSRSSKQPVKMPTSGARTSLLESLSDKAEEALELVVSVTGKGQEPFTAPRRVIANCDMSKGAACEMCPLMSRNGEMELNTHPHDSGLVRFIDVPANTQHNLLRAAFGARCSDRIEFDIAELWRVEELAVQPSIDERSDHDVQTPTRRTVWSFGSYRTTTNEKIRLVGQNVQDPKSGLLRFQSWVNQKVDMDIDRFRLTADIRDQLDMFRPDPGQSPLEKCLDIAGDMSRNVTMIVGRDLLHVGMDLVWHSPLAFTVKELDIDKGWLEMIVVGDTRTGKSEIALRLLRHYAAGQMISCEGVTFAGLIGGVQQIGNRWHMTWGVVPMNDRRLVILDEVSGMGERNIIEQMSSVRSAGVAQITKIVTESTSARTRLIWITNPQDGKFLAENRNGGIGALTGVVRNAEDIARFDFVMAASRGEVSAEQINTTSFVPGPPQHDADSCELLVKWSWSLGREDVRVSDAAVAAAARHAIALGKRYAPSPPIVQAENARFKVLRIAAAMAARTFSTSSSGLLLVGKQHVDDAVNFLDMIYSQESLAYGRMSEEESLRQHVSTGNLDKLRQLLRQHPEVFRTLHMNVGGKFRQRDFVEFQGLPEATATAVISKLSEWGLSKYEGQGIFGMTEEMIHVLQEIAKEGQQ